MIYIYIYVCAHGREERPQLRPLRADEVRQDADAGVVEGAGQDGRRVPLHGPADLVVVEVLVDEEDARDFRDAVEDHELRGRRLLGDVRERVHQEVGVVPDPGVQQGVRRDGQDVGPHRHAAHERAPFTGRVQKSRAVGRLGWIRKYHQIISLLPTDAILQGPVQHKEMQYLAARYEASAQRMTKQLSRAEVGQQGLQI